MSPFLSFVFLFLASESTDRSSIAVGYANPVVALDSGFATAVPGLRLDEHLVS